MNLKQFAGREVHNVLQFFETGHLAPDLKDIADGCANLAEGAALVIFDSPQLAVGLQHLLQAKDAFVRAMAEQTGIVSGQDATTAPVAADPTQDPTATGTAPQAPTQDAGASTVVASVDIPGGDVLMTPPATAVIGDSGGAGAGATEYTLDQLMVDPTTGNIIPRPATPVEDTTNTPDATAQADVPAASALMPGADHPITAQAPTAPMPGADHPITQAV